LDFLRHIVCKKGNKNLLQVYLEHLIDFELKLNDVESIELARECVSIGSIDLVARAFPHLLVCVEEVGDLVRTLNLKYAARIYLYSWQHL
jgi:hypothetical protein